MHQHACVLILALALGTVCNVPRTVGSEDFPPTGASSLGQAMTGPSPALEKRLREAEARIRRTESGDRLLASTSDVLFLQHPALEGARLARYLREPRRALVVDAGRARRASSRELELAIVRERARALADLAVSLVEDEQNAFQAELEYAVEAADQDPDFDARLREAYRAAEAAERERRRREEWVRSRGVEPGPVMDPRSPAGVMARLGAYLYLFSESPDEFYAIIEREQTDPWRAVRLASLNDFLNLHSKRLDELRCPERRYCWLDGRAYPRALGDAAKVLKDRGALRELRERVGVFQTVALQALTVKVNRWVRGERP